MQRNLRLKTERLAELTVDELSLVAGGKAAELPTHTACTLPTVATKLYCITPNPGRPQG